MYRDNKFELGNSHRAALGASCCCCRYSLQADGSDALGRSSPLRFSHCLPMATHSSLADVAQSEPLPSRAEQSSDVVEWSGLDTPRMRLSDVVKNSAAEEVVDDWSFCFLCIVGRLRVWYVWRQQSNPVVRCAAVACMLTSWTLVAIASNVRTWNVAAFLCIT